ncbi:MAG: (d)CMP kinase [Nitrospirae bacterium]|nr:(d)CMP kinase [Nitrospirota bacterium]
MTRKRIITIDGPSGAGKSTVARLLADNLGFQYLDTGALYRAVALYLRRYGLSEDVTDETLKRILKGLDVGFSEGRVFINGEDVSEAIRTPEIGHYSSVFSARRPVREFLFAIQRAYPEKYDTVVEGRDMGTVVFPDAWMKFFLDASQQERASRRYLQLVQKGMAVTMEEALQDVQQRDERDSRRELAPLKQARDAVYIDTTSMGIEETIKKMLEFLMGSR